MAEPIKQHQKSVVLYLNIVHDFIHNRGPWKITLCLQENRLSKHKSY